ncbi:hypothetical protein GDO81_030059 [Engystomops pustulosus]|uniref:Uncharacterized protein n=1 Tax=Engystomops pustulosus TaxID=76066 RepID=A0AAV6YBA1_ENGPU|nr:hypothetical protein GDO81_030059 [Engystomops pustulosus]
MNTVGLIIWINIWICSWLYYTSMYLNSHYVMLPHWYNCLVTHRPHLKQVSALRVCFINFSLHNFYMLWLGVGGGWGDVGGGGGGRENL